MAVYDKYTHMKNSAYLWPTVNTLQSKLELLIQYCTIYNSLRLIYSVAIIKMCLSNVNTWNVPVSAAAMLTQIVEV